LAIRHILLLSVALALPGQDILRPVDQSYVKPGPLMVVIKAGSGAQLSLDSAPVALKQEGPGALTALLKVTAGKHVLVLKDGGSEKRVEFTGGPGQPEFRVHPPAATCDTCHAVKDGAWGFRSLVVSDSCFGCHDTSKFAGIHTHVPDLLPDCQLCHMPHGSAAVKHLKFTRDVACKQCHG